MVLEVAVSSDKNGEAFLLGGVEQLAIAQLGPSKFMGRRDLVLRQDSPQRDWSSLVEQYAHSGRSQGATRRVLQHGANLLDGDAWKPVNEL